MHVLWRWPAAIAAAAVVFGVALSGGIAGAVVVGTLGSPGAGPAPVLSVGSSPHAVYWAGFLTTAALSTLVPAVSLRFSRHTIGAVCIATAMLAGGLNTGAAFAATSLVRGQELEPGLVFFVVLLGLIISLPFSVPFGIAFVGPIVLVRGVIETRRILELERSLAGTAALVLVTSLSALGFAASETLLPAIALGLGYGACLVLLATTSLLMRRRFVAGLARHPALELVPVEMALVTPSTSRLGVGEPTHAVVRRGASQYRDRAPALYVTD